MEIDDRMIYFDDFVGRRCSSSSTNFNGIASTSALRRGQSNGTDRVLVDRQAMERL